MIMKNEEKAKRYDEAIRKAKITLGCCDSASIITEHTIYDIFPELAESKDEKIRKAIRGWIYTRPSQFFDGGFSKEEMLAWLEKQGENCLVNFDEAEKEKNDFVSGQFIECRKSFDVFKEDNSYWFEYIGDDIYIGRSDNILNQRFHITPRQLYRLFTQQHCPKEENNVNEEANAPIEYNNFDVLPGLYKCVHRMFDGTPEGRLLFEVDNVYKCLSKHDRAEFEVSYGHSVYLEDPVVRKHFIPFEKQDKQNTDDKLYPKFKDKTHNRFLSCLKSIKQKIGE